MSVDRMKNSDFLFESLVVLIFAMILAFLAFIATGRSGGL
tara:strand:- start:169537 stop:169656 length:120 start_codon:yes stop_codon:yes gene_type:complete